MLKKLVPLALIMALGLSLSACGSSGSASSNVIKIGSAVALTGDSAPWGQPEKNALQMAVDDLNAKGGVLGKKIQLVPYDTRADATEAVNVAKRMVNDDKVVAIIGPAQSGVAIAMDGVLEQAKVPFVATTATSQYVTVNQDGSVKPYAFRTCFIDPFQGTVAAQFSLKTLNAKKAAIVYDVGSDYSSYLGKYFTAAFTKGGGQIVANEAFRSGEVDFRAILGRVKQQNPDVIFLPTMVKEAALAMKQARDLGITATFVGGDGWGSPDLVSLGGQAVEGGYFVNLASLDDPDIQGFLKDYRAKYNADPLMPNPVMAIDALDAIVNAIKTSNSTDPTKIAQALDQTKDLPVLSGTLTIDPATHNPLNKPAIIQQVKNGQFVFAQKFTTTDN